MSLIDYTLVSLGADCRARYQISLFRARTVNPAIARKEFEAVLFSSARTPSEPGTYFFDWLITPAAACVEAIETDFEGAFAFSDLTIMPSGSVRNAKSGIIFQHSFTRTAGVVLPETLANEYEVTKAKTQYLVEKTLKLMNSTDPVIYVRVGGSLTDAEQITRAIQSRHPRHPHKVLLVTMTDGACGRIVTESDRIFRYEMNNTVEKLPDHKWQGDDARWQAMFLKLLVPSNDQPAPL